MCFAGRVPGQRGSARREALGLCSPGRPSRPARPAAGLGGKARWWPCPAPRVCACPGGHRASRPETDPDLLSRLPLLLQVAPKARATHRAQHSCDPALPTQAGPFRAADPTLARDTAVSRAVHTCCLRPETDPRRRAAWRQNPSKDREGVRGRSAPRSLPVVVETGLSSGQLPSRPFSRPLLPGHA